MCRKGTNVALTVSDQRKAMHDSPEALSQWLRDIYTTGLQSNGILLVSGSVFAEFMDAYNRVVLGYQTKSVNRYLDDSVRGSIQRVQDVQGRVGFHHGLADPKVAPTASLSDDSDDVSQDTVQNSTQQTISDAFGLPSSDDSVADTDDGNDNQLSPGWGTPDSSDENIPPVGDDEPDYGFDSNVDNDSDDLSGKVYEDSESDQAAQKEVGYAELDSDTDSLAHSQFNAGDTASRIMSGTDSVLDSLGNDLQADNLDGQIQPTAQDNQVDQSDDGLQLKSQSDVTLTHDGDSTSLSSNLFGTTSVDDDSKDVTASSDSHLSDLMSSLDNLMNDGNNDDGSNDKPPF